jgi:hypothetical protein
MNAANAGIAAAFALASPGLALLAIRFARLNFPQRVAETKSTH